LLSALKNCCLLSAFSPLVIDRFLNKNVKKSNYKQKNPSHRYTDKDRCFCCRHN
jgi:hypothetical protein